MEIMALIVSGSIAGYLVFTHGVLLGDLAVVLGQDGARDGEGEGDEQHPGTEGGDTAPASFRSPDTSPHFTHNFSRFLNVKFQDRSTNHQFMQGEREVYFRRFIQSS